jgi:hypothetical protein
MHLTARETVATKERPGSKGRKGKPLFPRGEVYTPAPEFMYRSDTPPPCRNRPDLYNHGATGKKAADLDRAAVAVCQKCPFRTPCDAWATQNRMTGVWGGRTSGDRAAALRKARGGYPCKSAAQS